MSHSAWVGERSAQGSIYVSLCVSDSGGVTSNQGIIVSQLNLSQSLSACQERYSSDVPPRDESGSVEVQYG